MKNRKQNSFELSKNCVDLINVFSIVKKKGK